VLKVPQTAYFYQAKITNALSVGGLLATGNKTEMVRLSLLNLSIVLTAVLLNDFCANAATFGGRSLLSTRLLEGGKRILEGGKKKGKCSSNGISYQKKKKNNWHSCPSDSSCNDAKRGCTCDDGFWASKNTPPYPTCTPHSTCSGDEFASGGTDTQDITCIQYRATELTRGSRCYSQGTKSEDSVMRLLGEVPTDFATGKSECESLCLAELGSTPSNHALCCFLNLFNGACKAFTGFLEASSPVFNDVVNNYASATFEAEYSEVTCTRTHDLSASTKHTCSGDAVTVGIIDLPGIDVKDEEFERCEEACALYARVSGASGSNCCRMNHFNGRCNFYAGGAVQDSSVWRMSAINFEC